MTYDINNRIDAMLACRRYPERTNSILKGQMKMDDYESGDDLLWAAKLFNIPVPENPTPEEIRELQRLIAGKYRSADEYDGPESPGEPSTYVESRENPAYLSPEDRGLGRIF